MTVADLIKTALRTIGAIASGETPTANESSDALSALNLMLSSWSVEGFLIPEEKREEFDLVAGQGSYTFGSGGNFNSARPLRIQQVNVKKSDHEYPVRILNVQEWARVSDKTLQSSIPNKVYTSGSYPLETFYLHPIPGEANKLVVHSLKPLRSFASTSETISLPPGYEEAVLYNFAVRLSIEFGKAIDPTIAGLASELKANLMRKNMKPSLMRSDISTRDSYTIDDFYSGE